MGFHLLCHQAIFWPFTLRITPKGDFSWLNGSRKAIFLAIVKM
jgi:hypothetical protein